jgi:sialate O-acetylesterase
MKIITHFPRIILIILLANQIFAQDEFVWPDNAEAAVCLTYDDGNDNHLDIVRPDLNKYNFNGTFYCPGISGSLYRRMDEWRALVKDGHELGNHSLVHPCLRITENYSVRGKFLKPEYQLEGYTVREMIDELRIANTLLKAVDGDTNRTYGYTCADNIAGGVDFSDKITHLFDGARMGGNTVTESIDSLNLFMVPSFVGRGDSSKKFIDFVEKAAEKRTIAVFMFHGIGGANLITSREAHKELLEYLTKHKDRFWVTTFGEMVRYVRAHR